MIFSNDTTGLSGSRYIPMAEGYNGSEGAARLLVEGARNDYKMFRALLDIEARAINIQHESAGYVQESEYTALAEATASGIWEKIKEFFSKLWSKIKAIFHTFFAKIQSVFASNKELAKKYGKEVMRKPGVGNIEVKWRPETAKANEINRKIDDAMGKLADKITGAINGANKITNTDGLTGIFDEDSEKRFDTAAKEIDSSLSEDNYSKDLEDLLLDPQDKYQIKDKEVGGIIAIVRIMENGDKYLRDTKKLYKTYEKALNDAVKAADKAASEKMKEKPDYSAIQDNDSDADKENKKKAADDKLNDEVKIANRIYEAGTTLQDVYTKTISVYTNVIKIVIAQSKAAFMKAQAAGTISDKKLKEDAIYLDAVEEVAKNEVEDVIMGSIKDVDLTTTNNASLNVLDADVSNDPDKLVYADDPDYDEARTSGYVDSTIVGKESAYFAAPLW